MNNEEKLNHNSKFKSCPLSYLLQSSLEDKTQMNRKMFTLPKVSELLELSREQEFAVMVIGSYCSSMSPGERSEQQGVGKSLSPLSTVVTLQQSHQRCVALSLSPVPDVVVEAHSQSLASRLELCQKHLPGGSKNCALQVLGTLHTHRSF